MSSGVRVAEFQASEKAARETVAIVQPHELVSVSEQKFILSEYAHGAGLSISRFVGEDRLLSEPNGDFDSILTGIAGGTIIRVMMFEGLAAKLPSGLCDRLRSLGCDLRLVLYRRNIAPAA